MGIIDKIKSLFGKEEELPKSKEDFYSESQKPYMVCEQPYSDSVQQKEEQPQSTNSGNNKDDNRSFVADDDFVCPHCGKRKDKLDLYCYFLWEGGFCSDMRHTAPKVSVPSLVQFCPNCNRHYSINRGWVEMHNTSDYNWIEPVIYPALKAGALEYEQFDWDETVEFNQRLRLLWAYNDYFYRIAGNIPTEEDKAIAKKNLVRLMDFYEDPIMVAELLREAEMFDECISHSLKALETIEPEERPALEHIIELAKEQNNRPFEF